MRKLGDPIKKPVTSLNPSINIAHQDNTRSVNIDPRLLREYQESTEGVNKASQQTGLTPNQILEQRRLTQPKDQGVIRESNPQGTLSKVISIAGNPVEAARHYNRTGRVPDNFDRSESPRSQSIDDALDIVNPGAWLNYGKNAVIDANEGNLSGAGLNALSAVPGISLNSRLINRRIKPFVDYARRSATDHASGIKYAILEHMQPSTKGRPIYRSLGGPNIKQWQKEAHTEGSEFTKDWFYKNKETPNPELRDYPKKRIEKLGQELVDAKKTFGGDKELLPTKFGRDEFNIYSNFEYNDNNPFIQTSDKLVDTRSPWKFYLDSSEYESIDNLRGSAMGVNNGSSSITFKNRGLYQIPANEISDIATHEAAHTGQKIGYKVKKPGKTEFNKNEVGWSDSITKYNSDTEYFSANTKTDVGRKFEKLMVDPKKDKWAASPSELHAELMVARKLMADDIVKQGQAANKREAIEIMQTNSDKYPGYSNELHQNILNTGRLNRFFKEGVSDKDKIELLKLLPALSVPIMMRSKDKQQN